MFLCNQHRRTLVSRHYYTATTSYHTRWSPLTRRSRRRTSLGIFVRTGQRRFRNGKSSSSNSPFRTPRIPLLHLLTSLPLLKILVPPSGQVYYGCATMHLECTPEPSNMSKLANSTTRCDCIDRLSAWILTSTGHIISKRRWPLGPWKPLPCLRHLLSRTWRRRQQFLFVQDLMMPPLLGWYTRRSYPPLLITLTVKHPVCLRP